MYISEISNTGTGMEGTHVTDLCPVLSEPVNPHFPQRNQVATLVYYL